MNSKEYLTVHEAADFLHVKQTTLYAYVSRGLLTHYNNPNGKGSVYSLHELTKLKEKSKTGTKKLNLNNTKVSKVTVNYPQKIQYNDFDVVELAKKTLLLKECVK